MIRTSLSRRRSSRILLAAAATQAALLTSTSHSFATGGIHSHAIGTTGSFHVLPPWNRIRNSSLGLSSPRVNEGIQISTCQKSTKARRRCYSSLTARHFSSTQHTEKKHEHQHEHEPDMLLGKQTESEMEMTKDALSICHAAIDAVNPSNAIHSHFSYDKDTGRLHLLHRSTGESLTYDVSKYDNVFIASFGKAASAMALATAQIISQTDLTICGGMVITKDDHATKEQMDALSLYNLDVQFAGHPIPDERSIVQSSKLLSQLEALSSDTDTNTLVINCISGGGSALFCTPKDSLDLSNMSQLNQQLLACGMPITEMNVLRKKVESGKGGGLVRAAYPCTSITMVLSDVIGDPLDLIASGPSVRDESTWSDAWDLVERYGLGKGGRYELSDEVLILLQSGKEKEGQENLECDGDDNKDIFENSETVLVGNNALAVSAAAEQAKILGYNPVILGTTIEGEAAHIAHMYINMAEQAQYQRTNPSLSQFPIGKLPLSLIAGGETTVTLTENSGKGGRNQEIGLAAALKLKSWNLRDIVLASVGTDG